MKKIILTIAIASLVSFSSLIHAQGIGVGIKAGANFANQSITDISTESKTGFLGGAYVVLAFSEKWAIQPELLYSSQGSELPDLTTTSITSEFNYMSIPVLLRWKPISLLSIEAGPQFSVLLDAKIDGDDIKEDIEVRDAKDRNRKVGPLKKADDAHYIDTTKLTIEEVIEKLLSIIENGENDES